MRRLLSVVVALGVALAVPMAAGAHSGQTGGTDYQTTIATVPAGIDVRVIGGDDRLEVRRTTAREVVILGYGKEPYLRLDAQGTWENRNSPAVALNDERYTSDPVPEIATKLGPDWVQTSTGDSVIFHDHRAHWMGSQPPVDVRGEPGTTRTLYDWAVPMVIDESPVELQGTVVWVGTPASWLWWLLSAVLVIGALVVGLLTRLPVAALAIAGTVAAVLASVVTGVSQELDVPGGGTGALVALAIGGGALAAALLVGHRLRAVPAHATTVLLMVALVVGALQLVGLASTAFVYGLVPGPLPTLVTRLLVLLGLAGVGLVAGACARAWRDLLAESPAAVPPKAPTW
jgi:hypothetical protein